MTVSTRFHFDQRQETSNRHAIVSLPMGDENDCADLGEVCAKSPRANFWTSSCKAKLVSEQPSGDYLATLTAIFWRQLGAGGGNLAW